jgi:ribose/xylose/arabinose/galactoside ABC-type transport system permease subunit
VTAQTKGAVPPVGQAEMRPKRSLLSTDLAAKIATPLGFIILFILMQFWLDRGFFVAQPRMLNIHQNVPVLILATAAVVGLLGGAFDLSIAGTATLSAYLTIGLTSEQGIPFWLVILMVLAAGAAVGVFNAAIVSGLKVNVIIATLGTGSILLGLSTVYGGGAVMTASTESPLPQWFLEMGTFTTKLPTFLQIALVIATLAWAFLLSGKIPAPAKLEKSWTAVRAGLVVVAGVIAYFVFDLKGWLAAMSVLVGVYLVVVVVVWVFVDRTVYGRGLKATGSNPLAARLAGIRTDRETYRAFMVSGVLAALAGIAIASNQGSASPNVAGTFLLPAFAAAYLSTVIFSTGLFTVQGTAIGGIFIVWVAQGLIEGGLKFTWTDIVNGGVLIIAVSLSTLLRRRAGK